MKNEMIARASGDWITSIDADEEIGLTPESLESALEETITDLRTDLPCYDDRFCAGMSGFARTGRWSKIPPAKELCRNV